jgi:hypothetical protein
MVNRALRCSFIARESKTRPSGDYFCGFRLINGLLGNWKTVELNSGGIHPGASPSLLGVAFLQVVE